MAKIIKLTENQFGEMMAYHGSSADFDKFNHKKYLNSGAGSQCFGWGTYVTNDIAVADGYVEASKGNGERDFFNNLDPKQYLESLGKYDDWLIKDILKAYYSYVVHTLDTSNKPTYENVLHVIDEMIKFKQQELSCYLPLDKLIKMYNENPRFSNMSDEEKEIEIDKHKDTLADKERPVIIFKACKDIVTHFKPEMDEFLKNRFAYLYEVEIPDDNGFNYLSWYDAPTSEQQKAITDGIHMLEKRYNTTLVRDYIYGLIFESGSKVYKTLYDKFLRFVKMDGHQASKAVSLLLMQYGFDGIKYPSGTRWQKPDGASEDAYNYVIFDANKVKIVNKTRM